MSRFEAVVERFPLKGAFAISRGSVDEVEVVRAVVAEGTTFGQGECRPYPRYGETADGVVDAIMALRPNVERGLTRQELGRLMPPGAARNAVDCALLDLEAKLEGRPAHELLGLPAPQPVATAFTLALGTPDAMAEAARATPWPLYKLKLGGAGDLDRVRAVREAAPEARLVADANEAWDEAMLRAFLPDLAALGVETVEQPLHADRDAPLDDIESPVTLCADESCHDAASLGHLRRGYGMVNVKLDKTGGITGALDLVRAARGRGLKVMVGCMMGSSLAMAPAMLLAPLADLVDLDAPLWLKADRHPPLRAGDGLVCPAEAELWG
ncbi:MAG: dipeptide epimerase [Geminicoccaceae bacterium]|nr:dipeptide epimerase [Geminicoccaceae bacterium]